MSQTKVELGLNVKEVSTITTADNLDTLTLTSTDADANTGPNLKLTRNSSSPADGDVTGEISFIAENDGDEAVTYSQISSRIDDATDGTEDGRLFFFTQVGGSSTERLRFNGTEAAFNEGGADLDFRVEGDGNTHALFVRGSDDHVGINEDAPDCRFHIKETNDTSFSTNNFTNIDNSILKLENASTTNDAFVNMSFRTGDGMDLFFGGVQDSSNGNEGAFVFARQDSTNVELLRIDADGNTLVAKQSAAGGNTVGIELRATGQGLFTRDGGTVVNITRNSSDGELVKFVQDGSLEGSISVSGSTVSYSSFTGTHWSRLSDNSKPTILRGTIMESIDEMCDWYQAVAGEIKEPIALGDKSVGDSITFTSNGTEYTGTIVKEDDVKHTKCKVSNTADSKKVYGVFSSWDDQDDGLDDDVNDMNIAQVGTFIIRVNKDVTVEAGDLLVSNGDGTAKLQDDDIIRSKTVAKVNSNIKVETYSDGSYTVPCTLHC